MGIFSVPPDLPVTKSKEEIDKNLSLLAITFDDH